MSPSRAISAVPPLLAALLVVLVALLVVLANAGPALAHTELESADPEPDSGVDDLQYITLVYEGSLHGDGDHEIGLFDGDTRLATNDTQMEDERTITTDVLGPAPAAELTVRWVIVAADGDEQRGEYTFTLTESVQVEAPPTPSPRVAQAPTTVSPSASASPDVTSPQASSPQVSSPEASSTDPTAGPVSSSDEGDDAGWTSAGALALAGLGAAAVGAAVVATRRRG